MSTLFLISSAINTRFGVFDAAARLEQTLQTISSIRIAIPDAKLILLESGAVALDDRQRFILQSHVDAIKDCHQEKLIQEIYRRDQWSIVKNISEVKCFSLSLRELLEQGKLQGINRVYKISGRYRLNGNFQEDSHNQVEKIVISSRRQSQFPLSFIGVHYQYMSRLWSWPGRLTPEILNAYQEGLTYIVKQINCGKYCDIEHMLYAFLPKALVHEVSSVGVEGEAGPNGQLVRD